MISRTRQRANSGQHWPGFVDALTNVLLVFIFLLVVFVLAQVVLSRAMTGQEQALDRLNRQVNELADLLNLERQANTDLRSSVAQLSSSLQSTVAERDDLELRLSAMTARAEEAEQRVSDVEEALADVESNVTVGRETLELRLKEIVSLRRDIEALKQVRADLESQVATLAGSNEELTAEVGQLRDRRKALEAELAGAEERTMLAQKEIDEREVRLAEVYELYQGLEDDLEAERELTSDQRALIMRLDRNVKTLQAELQRLSAALDLAEAKDKESKAVIADLGQRLNRALATKVEELSRYRSEFFGRLRELLGDRKDIQVVGDRFVFQSEVLFDTASAELGASGQEQLGKLADELMEIARKIPADINWVLRVDGHTDARPISTPEFPSNWELSTARAISVVKFLISQGVPAERLAATGFADNYPLDDRDDEIAYRRNRRIELKLTER